MSKFAVHGNYFYGNEISDYGKENGYVDYATLVKSFDAVLSNDLISKTADIGYWDIENGSYEYYEVNGNTYTEAEKDEELERLNEELEELENDEVDTSKIEAEIEAFENAECYENDVYQWFIISDNGASILKDHTNEIVMYNEELDLYLWGVTHYGTSWDYVLTDIKCNVPYENE